MVTLVVAVILGIIALTATAAAGMVLHRKSKLLNSLKASISIQQNFELNRIKLIMK